MHHGEKSDIISCLTDLIVDPPQSTPSTSILDIALLVQLLRPETAVTIWDYVQNMFLPYIANWLKNINRLDIVWYVYLANSLKHDIRQSRETGDRLKVTLSTKIPLGFFKSRLQQGH